MKRIVTRGIPRSLLALAALGAISGHTLPAGRWEAQTSYGVGGQGYAAGGNLATGTQQGAGSEAGGSMLLGVVVNGVPLAADDATPAPNTRTDLPGVGYVVLNEQTVTGDGVHSSSMTVNMIHVYVRDALTGVTTGEIVVGSAQSAVAL